MAIITTNSVSNPKPVRPVDWTGNPLPDGASYAGGDVRFKDVPQDAPPSPVKASPTRRKRTGIPQTPEQRKAFGDRMRAYWAKKRGTLDSQSIVQPTESPSVSTDTT
jgi:hypothetical protein